MTSAIKAMVLGMLKDYRGDNLYRAQMAFRGFNRAQMQLEHGSSGMTRQAVLDSYRERQDQVDRAIAEVEAL